MNKIDTKQSNLRTQANKLFVLTSKVKFLFTQIRNLLKNPNGSEGFKHWIPIDLHMQWNMKDLITGSHGINFEGWSIESGENTQCGVTNKHM